MRRNYIFFTHSPICIKMYLNIIILGSNIKLSLLNLLFTLSFDFLRHVTFYNSFLTQRKQWKSAAEMTYN